MEDADLRIEIFTLCEAAMEQGGRLSLVGTFDALNLSAFPVLFPQMTVVLRLRFWPGEAAMHKIRLVIINPDGEPVGAEAEGMIQLNFRDPDQAAMYNLIVHMNSVQFRAPGEHTADFYLDDNLLGRLPFSVQQSEEGGGAEWQEEGRINSV